MSNKTPKALTKFKALSDGLRAWINNLRVRDNNPMADLGITVLDVPVASKNILDGDRYPFIIGYDDNGGREVICWYVVADDPRMRTFNMTGAPCSCSTKKYIDNKKWFDGAVKHMSQLDHARGKTLSCVFLTHAAVNGWLTIKAEMSAEINKLTTEG